MKKWVKYLIVSIALLISGYWGYKQLNDKPSLLGKIHMDADNAIKIGIHDIKETLVWDALSSPAYYSDQLSFSKSEAKTDSLEDKGIDLQPYNLVIYTVPSVKNTLFGTLEIENSTNFEAFIEKTLADRKTTIEKAKNAAYRHAVIAKSRIALAWNEHNLVLAFAPDLVLKKVLPVFEGVLVEGNTIKDKNHPLIEKLSDSDDHVVFAANNGTLGLNFQDGEVVLDGILYTETPQQYPSEISVETVPEASFELYFDANFERSENKHNLLAVLEDFSFFKKNQLSVSDILDRTNGFFSLAVKGKTTQTDTIITYEYDDNFEKVAKKSLTEKEVPRIHLNLGAENESLREYLNTQGVIGSNGLFEPFPLYQLYVREDAVHTSFESFGNGMAFQEQVRNTFFEIKADFERLAEDVQIPKGKEYLGPLKQLRVTASQKDQNKIKVKGSLSAEPNGINIISQWAFSRPKDSVQ